MMREIGFRKHLLAIVFAGAFLVFGSAATRAIPIKGTYVGEDSSGGSPYCYAQIEVSNTNSFPLEYRVTITQMGGARSSDIRFDARPLGPGETRVHHLPLPGGGGIYRSVEVRAGDGSVEGVSIAGEEKLFLNICEVAGWASVAQMQDFTAAFGGRAMAVGPAGWTPPPRGGRGGGSFPGVAGAPNLVSQIAPPSLPDNWLCYTPFRAVFVPDALFSQMEPVCRQALLQWVESGGDLTLYHSSVSNTEKRLLGTIRRQGASPLEAKEIRTEWQRARTAGDWRLFYGADVATTPFPYAIRQAGGKIGGIVLATLFFIVAGPLNHFYFSRRNRIRMLMISLPVLSLGFCLLITVYFLASQGFAKRGGSMSITILDERLDSAFTFSRHALLSGLYPLGGFQFDRQAAFYPLRYRFNGESFAMDLTTGQRLTSGLFRPSITFDYFSAMPYNTREKLVVDLAEKTVANGFELPIRKLILSDGKNFYQAGELRKGEKGPLKQVPTMDWAGPFSPTGMMLRMLARDHFDQAEKEYLDNQMSEFLRGLDDAPGRRSIYLVSFDGPSDASQPGTKIRAKSACNVLAGLME